MPMKKISLSLFSGLDRIMIAPTWATASVSRVGGSATGSPGVFDSPDSLRDTFLIPTIR